MYNAKKKQKDLWDKLASITPLIIGIAVTGIGALFTQVYNYRQLQLNQIVALDKLRPLLTSDKPEEREFGYSSFAALGYEDVAIRMINIKQDQSGRTVLVELQMSGSNPQVQANATAALESLDETKRLVNFLENGDTQAPGSMIDNYGGGYAVGDKFATELGLKTKLARAIIISEVIRRGINGTKKLSDETTKQLPGNPADGADEKAWITTYINLMGTQGKQERMIIQRGTQHRFQIFQRLIDKGDWELTTYPPPQPSVKGIPTNGSP